MNSSSIKIRMRICPKSIARTEIDLRMTFVTLEDLSFRGSSRFSNRTPTHLMSFHMKFVQSLNFRLKITIIKHLW